MPLSSDTDADTASDPRGPVNRVTTGLSILLQRDRVCGQPLFVTIEAINTCDLGASSQS
jgi:hypothetical protein